METLKQATINFVWMVLMVVSVAAMVAIVYGAHALANSQQLVDALVSTGHFTDARAAASVAAEAEAQARIDERVAEVCGR